jgi:N-ethylmaleimide reductase
MRKIFNGPIITASDVTTGSTEAILRAGDADLVAFGRHSSRTPTYRAASRLGRHRPLTTAKPSARTATDYSFHREEASIWPADGRP